MRTEDLLASCLETQAQGCSPAEWLAAQATPEQRAELEPLLALAGRLQTLAAPPLRPGVREAIAARIASEPRREPVLRGPGLPDVGSSSQVHSRRAGPDPPAPPRGPAAGFYPATWDRSFPSLPGDRTLVACLRLFFRGVKRAEHRGLLL